MKYIFAGGGSAGHINPALALASEVRRRDPSAEVLFIGTKSGLEGRLVPESGFPIEFVEISGFRRRLTLENVRILFRFFRAVGQCIKIIRAFEPDVVVGTGGYVSAPAVFAAHMLHVKTAIQEQNAVPGVTTKFLSRYADRIFTSFEETAQHLGRPEKTMLCGNPVRPEFSAYDYQRARQELSIRPDEFCILCIGGSLGAQRLNEVMTDLADRIAGIRNIRLTFATGGNYYDNVVASIQNMPANVSVRRYIDNMAQLEAASDLLIARSGAITISELSVLRKPAILIPSPNVANNHQYPNAFALSSRGAAILIEERELTVQRLYDTIQELMQNRERLSEMQRNLEPFAHPDARGEIVDGILGLVHAKS